MGHLMTATLLGSYKWMEDAPASWAVRARDDFYAKLRRQDKFEPTPEVQRGIEFERIICDRCNNMEEEQFMLAMRDLYAEKIKADPELEYASIESKEALLTRILNVCNTLYNQCKGGQQQVKVGKDIKVGDEEFYLFGYIDVLQPTTILDIKTCTKYKESKYRDSIQHSIYQYCTGVKDFKYVVADYNSTAYPENCIIVDTSINELEDAERRIKGRITNLVHFLKDNNLWDDYITIFCRGK